MRIDRTAGVVTGGASGLGAAVARMLADAGGSVVLLDLPGSAGARLAAELGAAARFVACDVTDPGQVHAAFEQAVAAYGRIDLLVNCAGVNHGHPLLSTDRAPFPLELFRQAVEINLIGTFDVLRTAAHHMAANEPDEGGERGLIVNVGSIAGLEGQARHAAYAASKGGVLAMTLPLARGLSDWGIRVLGVSPGGIDTPMVAALPEEARRSLAGTSVFPRRLGRPDEFAALVRALAESPLLNGENVRLDGASRLSSTGSRT